MRNIPFIIGGCLFLLFLACSKDDETFDDTLDIIEAQIYNRQKIHNDSIQEDDSTILVVNYLPDSLRMNINARCTQDYPLFVAHAGGRLFGPPNSIPAFIGSGMIGMWGCETDVRITSDRVLVCYHDKTLEEGTNGTGTLEEHTYEQIRQCHIRDYSNSRTHYDYSKFSQQDLRIPNIREFLDICIQYKMVPIMHIKTWAVIDSLANIIKQYDLEGKCIIASTIPDHFRLLRKIGCKERAHLFWGHSSNIDELLTYGNVSISIVLPNPRPVSLCC